MKIKDNVYSVGVANPNLRIFDIVMETKHGTTYNSYIVKGDKIALIDISHSKFSDQYIENIKKVCDPKNIDYIIVNHCEPDHTGALEALLKIANKAKIYTTSAGAINLKNITNTSNLNLQVVKDNEELDLGQNKTLQFIIAPFLHWPDSMFTYLKQDKIVFTCDFLGSHYSSEYLFDYEIKQIDEYTSEVKNYYDAIFGPFASYVQNGLKRLSALDFEYVCNSHGPILTKKGVLQYVMDKYNEWSQPINYDKQIPIFFASAYGYTETIANTICKTIKELKSSVEVQLYDINKYSLSELSTIINQCSTFCIGSSTLNHNAVAPIWNLLSNIDLGLPHKRRALVFGSYGWSGEGTILMTNYLKSIKVNVADTPIRICFKPTPQDLDNVVDATRKFIKEI